MNLARDDICSFWELVEGMKIGNGDWNLGIRNCECGLGMRLHFVICLYPDV